jgi:hypothetical protein
MRPNRYDALDSLPLKSNGKLDRAALPEPSFSAPLCSGPAGSQNPAAGRIAAIFAECLGLSSFGWDDDFFEQGGHSLTAIKAVAKIRQELHPDLSLKDIFDYPTPGRLAERLAHFNPEPQHE